MARDWHLLTSGEGLVDASHGRSTCMRKSYLETKPQSDSMVRLRFL